MDPARWKVERRLVFMLDRAVVEAGEGRLERNLFAVLFVAFGLAESEAEREGGVGRGTAALNGEFGGGDFPIGLALIFVLRFDDFSNGARGLVEEKSELDH